MFGVDRLTGQPQPVEKPIPAGNHGAKGRIPQIIPFRLEVGMGPSVPIRRANATSTLESRGSKFPLAAAQPPVSDLACLRHWGFFIGQRK
jgi:hypothetical protein